MATVILARERAVTALRSFIEQHGGDFSAKWAGKWKMVFQCLAAGFSIGKLQWFDAATRSFSADLPTWVTSGLNVTLWVALALTIYSGLEYIWVSVKVLKRMDG